MTHKNIIDKDQNRDWLSEADRDLVANIEKDVAAIFPRGLNPSQIEVILEIENRIFDRNNADNEADQIVKEYFEYKRKHQLRLKMNSHGRLLKIGRRREDTSGQVINNGPEFSVIYPNSSSEGDIYQNQKMILYRGKAGHLLGSGGYGRVKIARAYQLGQDCAVKVQQRRLDWEPKRYQDSIQAEVQGLSSVDLHYKHSNPEPMLKNYIVMPLLEGLDGYDTLEKHIENFFVDHTSLLVSLYMMVDKVQKLHDTDTIHGDIKPENFIIKLQHNESSCNLIDLQTYMNVTGDDQFERPASNFVYTEEYVAPELEMAINAGEPVPCSKRSDIYAIGIILKMVVDEVLSAHITRKNPGLEQIYIDEQHLTLYNQIAKIATNPCFHMNSVPLPMAPGWTREQLYVILVIIKHVEHFTKDFSDRPTDMRAFISDAEFLLGPPGARRTTLLRNYDVITPMATTPAFSGLSRSPKMAKLYSENSPVQDAQESPTRSKKNWEGKLVHSSATKRNLTM